MSKSTKKDQIEDDGISETPKEFVIKDAKLNDGYCDYKFEVLAGTNKGDLHKVDGEGLFKETLQKAFNQLYVHAAFIDNVFTHANVEIVNINRLHGHELTGLYSVTGFKIKGGVDNESVILTCNKFTPTGYIGFDTPKIALDSLSSYKWLDELKAAIEKVRDEVVLYKDGNCILPETEDPKYKQMTIADGNDKGEEKVKKPRRKKEETTVDQDLENAEV